MAGRSGYQKEESVMSQGESDCLSPFCKGARIRNLSFLLSKID